MKVSGTQFEADVLVRNYNYSCKVIWMKVSGTHSEADVSVRNYNHSCKVI